MVVIWNCDLFSCSVGFGVMKFICGGISLCVSDSDVLISLVMLEVVLRCLMLVFSELRWYGCVLFVL